MESNIIKKWVSIWFFTISVFILPSALQAEVESSIGMKNGMLISPAPLQTVEENGEGHASFSITENFGGTAPATNVFNEPSTVLIVTFANLTLKDADVSLISGPLLDYYTPTFDAAQNKLIFNQTADIPMLTTFDVDIPIAVTANTSQENPNNLIEVNIQTNSNVVTSDGFSKSFTYTKKSTKTISNNKK